MASFSGDLIPPTSDPPPTVPYPLTLTSSSSPHPQISGMFSYLSSIREERDRVEANAPGGGGGGLFAPRRLITSTSATSSWGDVGGVGGGPFHNVGGGLSGRSLWTKYCLMCTLIGSAATILAAIFLIISALFRYYTTSINYFETVPTYLPAILLSICGVSTIAFSCKRNRNIILLRITACWSLCSAALSSVITITTSLIHMNRLQTLKECVYSRDPPACSCYSHVHVFSSLGGSHPKGQGEGSKGVDFDTDHDLDLHHDHDHHGGVTTYVFQNTPDCEVIHGILYSCLRAVFAISVVAVLLSIFLCMLLYQLIGHERKKAYWSRIRRINSDWSADFIACLSRPLPRDRSSVLPLMLSSSSPLSPTSGGHLPLGGCGWGPPPPYEEVAATTRPPPFLRRQPPALRLTTSHSDSWLSLATPSPHPFSPTIAMDPGAGQGSGVISQTSRQRVTLSQGNVNLNPAPLRDPIQSMGSCSITSLSIPLPTSSTNTLWSTNEEYEVTEDDPEEGVTAAEAETTADGGNRDAACTSATTCRSLMSEAVFADSLEADLNIDLDVDLDLDIDARIRLLDEELAKLGAVAKDNADEGKVKVNKRNYSLPSSPLVRVRRLLFKGERRAIPTPGNSSSAQNLHSFSNMNWSLENGEHYLEQQPPKEGRRLPEVGGAATRGTSLPTSPNRKQSQQLLIPQNKFMGIKRNSKN